MKLKEAVETAARLYLYLCSTEWQDMDPAREVPEHAYQVWHALVTQLNARKGREHDDIRSLAKC